MATENNNQITVSEKESKSLQEVRNERTASKITGLKAVIAAGILQVLNFVSPMTVQNASADDSKKEKIETIEPCELPKDDIHEFNSLGLPRNYELGVALQLNQEEALKIIAGGSALLEIYDGIAEPEKTFLLRGEEKKTAPETDYCNLRAGFTVNASVQIAEDAEGDRKAKLDQAGISVYGILYFDNGEWFIGGKVALKGLSQNQYGYGGITETAQASIGIDLDNGDDGIPVQLSLIGGMLYARRDEFGDSNVKKDERTFAIFAGGQISIEDFHVLTRIHEDEFGNRGVEANVSRESKDSHFAPFFNVNALVDREEGTDSKWQVTTGVKIRF